MKASRKTTGRALKDKLGGGIQGLAAATNTGGHHAGPAPTDGMDQKKRGGAVDGKVGKKRLDRHGGHIGGKASGGGASPSSPYSGAASGHFRKGGGCG
jgi:hypothetical protein